MQRASNITSWRFYLLFTQIFTRFCLPLSSQANFSQQASANQIWKMLVIIPRLMSVMESLKLFSLCTPPPQTKSRKGRGGAAAHRLKILYVRLVFIYRQAHDLVLEIGLGFELQDLCSCKPCKLNPQLYAITPLFWQCIHTKDLSCFEECLQEKKFYTLELPSNRQTLIRQT